MLLWLRCLVVTSVKFIFCYLVGKVHVVLKPHAFFGFFCHMLTIFCNFCVVKKKKLSKIQLFTLTCDLDTRTFWARTLKKLRYSGNPPYVSQILFREEAGYEGITISKRYSFLSMW